MACYHCSVKVLSRGGGRSSVQFSAYMSGEKLYDERLGEVHDQTSKEEVIYNQMLFAERVPEQLREQEAFWNSVELSEKSNSAQVSRTWEIALPHELTLEQNQKLAEVFAMSLRDKDGMPAVQLSIHAKDGNLHAHLMAPMRDMDEQGKWLPKSRMEYLKDEQGNRIPVIDKKTGEQKVDSHNRKQWKREKIETVDWNSKGKLMEWRERTALYQNHALEKYGHDVRVDHRSLKDQGIDREPTIHEGYTARLMGERSDRVQHNLTVREHNLLRQVEQELQKFKENIENVREELAERIRGISRSVRTRADERTVDSDRDRSPEPERGAETIARDPNLAINNREAQRRKSETERLAREAERERLAIEREREEIERIERTISHSHGITR